MERFTFYSPTQYDSGETGTDTIYSDRLYQWDSSKYNQLCKKHFGNEGQSFFGRETSKIQDFLSEYLGKNIEICRIEQLENQSNGYPYWRFDFKYI